MCSVIVTGISSREKNMILCFATSPERRKVYYFISKRISDNKIKCTCTVVEGTDQSVDSSAHV